MAASGRDSAWGRGDHGVGSPGVPDAGARGCGDSRGRVDALTRRGLSRTATQIFGGTSGARRHGAPAAGFVSTFLDSADRTDDELERFLAPLRTGPAQEGGQEFLRVAYRHYLEVARTPPSDAVTSGC